MINEWHMGGAAVHTGRLRFVRTVGVFLCLGDIRLRRASGSPKPTRLQPVWWSGRKQGTDATQIAYACEDIAIPPLLFHSRSRSPTVPTHITTRRQDMHAVRLCTVVQEVQCPNTHHHKTKTRYANNSKTMQNGTVFNVKTPPTIVCIV